MMQTSAHESESVGILNADDCRCGDVEWSKKPESLFRDAHAIQKVCAVLKTVSKEEALCDLLQNSLTQLETSL